MSAAWSSSLSSLLRDRGHWTLCLWRAWCSTTRAVGLLRLAVLQWGRLVVGGGVSCHFQRCVGTGRAKTPSSPSQVAAMEPARGFHMQWLDVSRLGRRGGGRSGAWGQLCGGGYHC